MISGLIAAGLVAGSVAHPLGNFSVNRYDGLVITERALLVDHVQDLAEIPTAQAMTALDTDRDGQASAPELAAWSATACRDAVRSFRVTVDGRAVTATVQTATARTTPGQAGLPTLRAECRMSAPAGPGAITFHDGGASGQVGWQEITARGDRMTLLSASVPTTSRSARLTRYPGDMLQSPLRQESATLRVREGGLPLNASPATDAGPLTRGADRFTEALTSLVVRRGLTPGFAIVAFLIAFLLGALHALAPGHGKTIMAAHAAGNGHRSLRDILSLGLTVTVTHTVGVFTLGLLITSGALVAPANLFPWLGAVSGILVAAAGVFLLRRALHNKGHTHTHTYGHTHGHTHGHGHGHGHGHESGASSRQGGVVLMGVAGGMVPSPSAVVVLVGGAALGRVWFGVVLVLAYGLGLAAALVGIGALVVGSGRVLARRVLNSSRLRRFMPASAMPIGTSATVVALGLGLTLRSLALG